MALAITSFTPASASSLGGTQISITGTNLDTATAFLVGSKQAQVVSVTPTLVVIRVPAQAAGSVKLFAVDEPDNILAASATSLTVVAGTSTRGALTGAAKWGVDIDLSVAQDGSMFTKIRAITNVVPGLDQSTQDTSSYDDYDPVSGSSWKSQAPTQYGWSLALTFDRSKFSGAYDPAQEAIRAASDKANASAIVLVRWYDRSGGPEAWQGNATVTWAEQGGDTAAKSNVQSTLSGDGPRQAITNPSS